MNNVTLTLPETIYRQLELLAQAETISKFRALLERRKRVKRAG